MIDECVTEWQPKMKMHTIIWIYCKQTKINRTKVEIVRSHQFDAGIPNLTVETL